MSKLSDYDDARGAVLDAAVRENAVRLDEKLRTIEKQQADELARFGPAPEPKAKAASKK